MKIKVGFGPDPQYQSTWKLIIEAETTDSRYVVREHIILKDIFNHQFFAYTPLYLLPKDKVRNIAEEKV